MRLLKTCLLITLPAILPVKIFAQQVPPGIDKNKEYQNAVRWLDKNHFIFDSLEAYNVPPDEAVAIVFPQLMRYSALGDRTEVTGLMVLYIRLGKEYADFSIGHFQMKPSFVQQLEKDAHRYLPRKEIKRICPRLLNGNDKEITRRERVISLTDLTNEVSYLALFYKICLRRFKNLHFKNKMERIRFLSTAYNCGYHHSAKTLLLQMNRKQFPLYDGWRMRRVNYACLSLLWWDQQKHAPEIAENNNR